MPQRTKAAQPMLAKNTAGKGTGMPAGKRRIILAGLLVGLALAVALCAAARPWQKRQLPPEPMETRATVALQNSVQQAKATADEPVDEGSYRVNMNNDWVFQGGSSNAYVRNHPNNTRTVYFDVFLADTKELVYSSPYLPVGGSVQGFALDAALDPGVFKGIVTYHLVDDDHREVSTLSVTVALRVQ